MKIAISIPDKTHRDAERLCHRLKRSRSSIYAQAMSEFVARHEPDGITEAINKVCDAIDSATDPAIITASQRTLEGVEW
jgi:predicted transcriptional regulator